LNSWTGNNKSQHHHD